MKGKILIFLLALIMLIATLALASCGDDEQFQIGYSGGNVGYDFHYTRSNVGNQINIAGNNFTSAGHHLVGFFTVDGLQYFDENGKQLPNVLIEGDIYVIAKEAPNEYTFNFNLEDDTFEDGSTEKSIVLKYGENDSSKIPTATHQNEKYEFDGWFDGKTRYTYGATFAFDKLYSLEHNAQINLTPKFKIKEYTVTLDFNDGVTEREKIKVKHGETIGDLNEYYMDNGAKDITGWSYISYGEIPVTEAITEDITIFAIWTEYKDVTFSCGEYGDVTKRIHIVPGRSVELPVYLVPGYKATAWYNNSIFSGNPVERVPYGALVDTYYGKFEETDYQITFTTQTDENIDPITYSYGNKIDLPVLTREEYLFLGWKRANDDTLYFEVSSKDWGDISFTAEWLHSVAISTPEDLDKIRANPNDNYHLINDIDLNGTEWTPIPSLFGIFDGNGHKISNFVLPYKDANDGVGFVEVNSYKIQNLTLENVSISFSTTTKELFRLGILCAENQGEITDCRVDSSIAINCVKDNCIAELRIGGVCGINNGKLTDTISNTEIALKVPKDFGYTGRIRIGGLIGINEGTVNGCEVTGKITDIGDRREYSSTKLYIGGAISENMGRIENTYADMELTSAVMKDNTWDNMYIGGLVAINNGDILACYSKGRINASYGRLSGAAVGGLAASSSGNVENCYSTVGIVANKLGDYCGIGGLVGSLSGTIINSYSQNTEIKYTVGYVGGLVGSSGGDAFVKGSFTNYNRSFGKETNYSSCSFNATGTTERDLFDVLNWDREIWAIDGILPRLNWEFDWADIDLPEIEEPYVPSEEAP